MPRQQHNVTLRTEKFVHGGQVLAHQEDGTPVFVWGALPGELIEALTYRKKRRFIEATTQRVIEPSADRVSLRDEAFLSTSPWQIVSEIAEQRHKQDILAETMRHEGIVVPDEFIFHEPAEYWRYRNKMEYSFFGDDDGLHLALFQRGSHRKNIVEGSSIARSVIDEIAGAVLAVLQQHEVRAGDLKTLVVRSNQAGDVVAALFVKRAYFPRIEALSEACQGLAVYYSTPKSPASVATYELYRFGDTVLQEQVLGHTLRYDVLSFFQVNVAEFEKSLQAMQPFVSPMSQRVDVYAGVGAIAAALDMNTLIEIDEANIALAEENVGLSTRVIHASAQSALGHIPGGRDVAIVVDPPRAGLHKHVVQALLDKRPERIAYLSCNPITQARDVALLQQAYTMRELHGYNFFPRTPHIESLALLEASAS